MLPAGARDPRVHEFVLGSGLAHCCLFAGRLHPRLARAAPYLVALPRDAAPTRTLLADAWGQSWGVLVRATSPLNVLYRHFRRLLRVQDFAGRYMLFRYYDPRVLRLFLPTCTPAQLAEIFGPVERFIVEAETSTEALQFFRHEGSLVCDTIEVARPLAWLGGYLRAFREALPGSR
jgi:hypothetical protein